MLLKVGDQAPVFSLPDADMETVDLAAYKGKKACRSLLLPQGRDARLHDGSNRFFGS